jgi:hypothetical protein
VCENFLNEDQKKKKPNTKKSDFDEEHGQISRDELASE